MLQNARVQTLTSRSPLWWSFGVSQQQAESNFSSINLSLQLQSARFTAHLLTGAQGEKKTPSISYLEKLEGVKLLFTALRK